MGWEEMTLSIVNCHGPLEVLGHLFHRSLCCCVTMNTAQPTLIRVCWIVCMEAHAAVLGEILYTGSHFNSRISPFSVTQQTATTRDQHQKLL